MYPEQAPVCGHDSRLEWLVQELQGHLASPTADIPGARAIVAWYMSYGFSIGMNRAELENALRPFPEIQRIALSIAEQEISQGKPPPKYAKGQLVEVIVNAKNITYHRGSILDFSWHHNDKKWFYMIEENGKKVGKRYESGDIRALEG